jgi:hypothetical protein
MRFTEFISEAGSPKQQAAIAIAMKKAGKKPKSVSENDTAAGINKMFNNLGDPVFSNLQRVALLAMQGRQQEASGRLQSVIKDASPAVQKKIIDAVNNIKPVTINGKIADSSTIDKSKSHQDWILNTFIPWVQSLLDQQGVAEGYLNEERDARIKRIRELSEGLSTDDLAKVPMFVVNSLKKAAYATGREAVETKDAIQTAFNWGQATPEQKQAAKKQLIDVAKIAAGLALAAGVGHVGAATLGVGHAATTLGAIAKTTIEHLISDIGIEAVAEVLATAGGITIVKNALHDITTSSGHEFEKSLAQQQAQPAQAGTFAAGAPKVRSAIQPTNVQQVQRITPMQPARTAVRPTNTAQVKRTPINQIGANTRMAEGFDLPTMEGIKNWLLKFKQGLGQEADESKEMLDVYARYTQGFPVNDQEMAVANEQLKDVARGIGMGIFAAIPGHVITVPILFGLAKKFNIQLLPSAFNSPNQQGVAESSSNAVTFFRGEPILSQERLNQLKSSIGKPYPILKKEGSAANIGTYMSPDGDKATSFVKQALAGQGKGGAVTQIQVNPNSFSKGDGGIDEAVIITNIAGLVSNQTPNKNDPLRIQDRKQAMLKYLGPGVKKYLNDPLLSDPKIVQSWYNPEFAQKNWNTINSGKQAVTKPGESNIQERMMRVLGPLAENIRRDPEVISYFISHNPGDWVEYNFRMNSDGSGTKVVDVKYYPPAKQGVAEGERTIFSPGTQVTVPHKGKMVSGKIVRYDSGKGIDSPAYIVDISEYESLIVPVSRVKQDMDEGENWSKHNNPRAGGMSKKSVSSYRRSHPGSKIQTAVTTKPSKLKKGSKAAKRRASFCARMRGMKKHRTGAKTAHDPNSNINKSLRRWHCESIEELHQLVMLAEQFIRNNKK